MKKRSRARRVRLLFLAGCAGVLAAGMAAVWGAGRFVPPRQVTARTALPVHNALGVESADVLFWPEEIWEEYSLTDAAVRQENLGFVPDLARPWLILAGWDAGTENGLPGSCWRVSAQGSECFFARDVHFSETLPGGDDSPRSLTAQVSVGRRDTGFAVTCRVFAPEGYQDLPDDWQETAVQRCRDELKYLFGFSEDERYAGLYEFLEELFRLKVEHLGDVQFAGDEMTAWWQDEGILRTDSLLYELAGAFRTGQTRAMQSYYRASWLPPTGAYEGLYPHEVIPGDTSLGDAELARVLLEAGLDAQVVTMEQQAMLLFSWEGGDVAVYYDPVLDCFSGYSLQA